MQVRMQNQLRNFALDCSLLKFAYKRATQPATSVGRQYRYPRKFGHSVPAYRQSRCRDRAVAVHCQDVVRIDIAIFAQWFGNALLAAEHVQLNAFCGGEFLRCHDSLDRNHSATIRVYRPVAIWPAFSPITLSAISTSSRCVL